MPEQQTIEIKVQLRDEISRAAEQAVGKLLRLDQVSTGRAVQHFNLLGQTVERVGREIRSLLSITGVSGILGAGGIVAGMVAAKRALDDFAQSGLRMHYTARELGVTTDMLHNYTDALRVVGQSESEAAGGITAAINTLEEAFTRGSRSSLYQELAKGARGTGQRLFHDLMQSYQQEGPEKALQLALDRMSGMSARAQAHFSKILGVGTVGAAELRRILPQLVPLIHTSKEEMLEYNIANINLERTWGNIKTQIGTALLPAFTELTRSIDTYLQSDAGKRFLADIEKWIQSISVSVRSEGFATQVDEIVKGTQHVVTDLGKAFTAADAVVQQMGITWPAVFEILIASQILVFLGNLATALAAIGKWRWLLMLLVRRLPQLAFIYALYKLLGREFPDTRTEEEKKKGEAPKSWWEFFKELPGDIFRGNIDIWGKGKKTGALGLEGEGKSAVENLADLATDRVTKQQLTKQFAALDYSLGKLNAYLLPGGPEGRPGEAGFGVDSSVGKPDTWTNDLSQTAYDRMMGGGAFAGKYQAVVDAARANNLAPSLMAGILGFETGYGKSRAVRDFNNPAGLMAGVGKANKVFMKFGTIEQGIAKAGEVQSRIFKEGGGTIAGMGAIYAPPGVANDPKGTNKEWPATVARLQQKFYEPAPALPGTTPIGAGGIGGDIIRGTLASVSAPAGSAALGAGFDQTAGRNAAAASAPMPSVRRAMVRENMALRGSADVHIDISDVQKAKDASVGENLFRPLIIQRTAQMAATGSDRSTPSYFNQA
jgi:hypothetical protein